MDTGEKGLFSTDEGEVRDGDVLAVGEAVLERVKAISHQLSERVRQLTGETVNPDDNRSD